MTEDRNRRAAELSEAALEGVSGGDDEYSHTYDRVLRSYCLPCRASLCGHTVRDLTNYILEHGNISNWTHCPFRKEA